VATSCSNQHQAVQWLHVLDKHFLTSILVSLYNLVPDASLSSEATKQAALPCLSQLVTNLHSPEIVNRGFCTACNLCQHACRQLLYCLCDLGLNGLQPFVPIMGQLLASNLKPAVQGTNRNQYVVESLIGSLVL
jgi:hypothetical protein